MKTSLVSRARSHSRLCDRDKHALAELQRYLGKFGNDGAKYFADGLNYEDALSRAFDSRGERISQLETELASEKQKLAAAQLGHGERDPIATGSAPAIATQLAKAK